MQNHYQKWCFLPQSSSSAVFSSRMTRVLVHLDFPTNSDNLAERGLSMKNELICVGGVFLLNEHIITYFVQLFL